MAWALFSGQFRNPDDSWSAGLCLPIAAVMAVLLSNWLLLHGLARTAFWLSLGLLGQAATLQLIEAGPFMRYQHYPPIERLISEPPVIPLLILLVQAVAVIIGLIQIRPCLRRWAGRLSGWMIPAFAAVFLMSSTVSQDVARYLAELMLAGALQILHLATLILMVGSVPDRYLDRLRNIFWTSGNRGRLSRFVPFTLAAALWVTAASAFFSLYVYQNHPHIPDEVTYLLQARFLAEGHLAMPAPPVPEAFELYLMQVDGSRWFPTPPFGWPLVLAAGFAVGAPWLINPLLAGLNTILTAHFLKSVYSESAARISVVLLSCSPWFLFMGMNFMTHMLTLTCGLLAALAVVKARSTERAVWAILAGTSVGFASLIRPLDGLIIGVLIGLWAIGVGGRRLKIGSLAGLAAATALIGAMVLPYNHFLTGNALEFPIMQYTDQHFGAKSNALGFGPERGMGWPIDPYPGHGPIDALVNANLNTFSINTELFGWGTGSLLLVAVALFGQKLSGSDRLMAAAVIATFTAHFFYYFSGGPDFGARYWFLMLIPCLAFSVRGMQYLASSLGGTDAASLHAGQSRVLIGVLVLCLFTLVNYLPWRSLDKYYRYLQMRPDVAGLAEQYEFGRSVVLVRGDQHPDYASAAVYNPIDLNSNEPIYVWARSPQVRDRVLQAYGDRPVWLVEGPSLSGDGYRVIGGPLNPAAVTRNIDEHQSDNHQAQAECCPP